MNRRILSFISLICISAVLTGCELVDSIPELTVEQTEMVTEYAAGLLLKYDSNTPSRLLPEGMAQIDEFVEVQPVVAPEGEISQTQTEPEVSADDTQVNDLSGDNSNGNSSYSDVWSECFGTSGLAISYTGLYEVLDTYPAEGDNVYFTTDASAGNKLLVMHFALNNTSASDANVNMSQYGLKYRVSVNGGDRKFILTTMLENDILSYSSAIASGQSVDLVAIAEIDEATAANIDTLDFVIKSDSNSSEIKLK